MAAVSTDGLALRFASPRRRAERHVAFAAVRQNGAALEFCERRLRNDEELHDRITGELHGADFEIFWDWNDVNIRQKTQTLIVYSIYIWFYNVIQLLHTHVYIYILVIRLESLIIVDDVII